MWSPNRMAGFAAAALISGCTTVGPDFKAPAGPAQADYGAAAERAGLTAEERPAQAWWMALGSADLDQVIRQALKDSPTLAEADATLASYYALADAARGGRKPSADLSAGAQHQRFNTQVFPFRNIPSPTFDIYSVGANVAYNLDLYGGGRRSVERADAQAQAQARRADAAYLALTGEIALQAVEIAGLREEIAAVEAAIADDRRMNQVVADAIKAGGEAAGARFAGEARLAEDESDLPPLARRLEIARHRLTLLSGHAPGAWASPDFQLSAFATPQQIPVSLPSALVHRRPDILAAEADLHAATAEIGVRTAALYPDIQLRAGLTQSARSPGNLFDYDATGWNLAGALSAPLLRGGVLKAERRAAEAEARAAMARYQQTVLTAFTQVADALSSLAQDDATLAARARAEAANAQTLRTAETAYRLGGGDLIGVIDAQRELDKSRRERVRAEADRHRSAIRLFAASAADWRITETAAR